MNDESSSTESSTCKRGRRLPEPAAPLIRATITPTAKLDADATHWSAMVVVARLAARPRRRDRAPNQVADILFTRLGYHEWNTRLPGWASLTYGLRAKRPHVLNAPHKREHVDFKQIHPPTNRRSCTLPAHGGCNRPPRPTRADPSFNHRFLLKGQSPWLMGKRPPSAVSSATLGPLYIHRRPKTRRVTIMRPTPGPLTPSHLPRDPTSVLNSDLPQRSVTTSPWDGFSINASKISVIVVAAERLFRLGLARLLSEDDRLDVIGVSDGEPELTRALQSYLRRRCRDGYPAVTDRRH